MNMMIADAPRFVPVPFPTPKFPIPKIEASDTPFATGPGDGNAVDPNDVKQNGYGSCGVLSTLETIAQQDPSAIQNIIKDNGDGSYTVTFQDKVSVFGQDIWIPREVTVTGPFDSGAAHTSGDVNAKGQQEIWPRIIEKAYAQAYKPNDPHYDPSVPNGGGVNPADAMEHILGAGASTTTPASISFADMSAKLDSGEAVVAWTADSKGYTADQAKLASEYNIKGGHAYSVTDLVPKGSSFTDPNTGQTEVAKEDTVILDNPWGSQDVVMPYSDYQTAYYQVNSAPTH